MMDQGNMQKLHQYLMATRALHRSVEKALSEGMYAGIGRMAVKQYNGIQRQVAEMFPEDFYLTETLTLEIESNMPEDHMVGQVQLATSQLLPYLEGLIRDRRSEFVGGPGPQDFDNLRNMGRDISDQIINMTKTTLRRALSNVDVDIDLELDRERGGRHELNLEGQNLEGANFAGQNLRGSNLNHAVLRGANLSASSLNDATMEGIDAEGVNLSGTSLRNVNLNHANLQGANMTGANLRDANLEGATLTGARLEGANLRGANVANVTADGARLDGANLRDANLERANFVGARLDGANLRGANLEFADLTDARLDGADLRDTNLENAKLPDDLHRMGVNLGHGGPHIRPPMPPRPPQPPMPPMGKRKIEIDIEDDQEAPKPKNDDLL